MGSPLPWASCGNEWNTEYCAESSLFQNKTLLNDLLTGKMTNNKRSFFEPLNVY